LPARRRYDLHPGGFAAGDFPDVTLVFTPETFETMDDNPNATGLRFQRLVEIMAKLRAPDGVRGTVSIVRFH